MGRRQIPDDWCDVGIPDHAVIHDTALIECSRSFYMWHSEAPAGLEMAEGSGIYYGAVLDVGRHGRVRLGRCALLPAGLLICDELIEIGDHALISWNVVIMDTYRVPLSPEARRRETLLAASRRSRESAAPTRPVRIENNVWIGFDSVVLPGVTIGEGSIVGCRSVVANDVPPYTIVGGNPARVIKDIPRLATTASLEAVNA